MAAPAEDRLARIVKWLALVFALAVGIGLPGEYFGLHYSDDIQRVELTAKIKADDLTVLVAANPELWMYQLQRMEELLLRSPPPLVNDRATIRDATGNALLTVGGSPRAPILVRSSSIYDSGRVVGQVEITHSYREMVFGALLAGLLGLLLGGLVYATLAFLPMRALRRMGVALDAEQAALKERERRFHLLFDRTADGIMIVSSTGKLVEINESFARMHGYSVEEMLNINLKDLDAPETFRLVPERIQKMASGESIFFEAEHFHKDGHVFPLEVSASLLDSDGETLIQAFHRDITARKQAEIALARQKVLYDMLSQTNQAIVRITNREELFPSVCRIAVERGRFRFAWIGLADQDDPRLKPVARYGADAGYIDQLNSAGDGANALRQGLTGRTLLSGTYVISNDFLNDPAMAPWHEAARRAGVRATGKFPIRQGGAVVGAMSVYAGDQGFFTAELVTTLDEIANNVSFALDNFAREAVRRKGEQALREGEERYRQLFEANPHPMWVFDTETLSFLAVNDAAVTHYGWSREEFLAMTLADVRPAETVPALLEHLAADNEQKIRTVASSKHCKKDGTLIDVEISSHVVDFGGRQARVVAVHDITERKLMQDKLRDSIAFRESLLQAMPLPVFHKDASGRYTGCNVAFTEFLGKTVNDVVGKTVYEVSPQNLAQTYRDKDLDLLDDPVGMQVYESGVMHADGTVHEVIFHKARLVDSVGRPAGIVGAITDITVRKHMEEALRAAAEQFRGLVEQSIAGIYIIQDGKLDYVNPRFAEIHGYGSAEELLGRDPLAMIAEKDRGSVAENTRRLLLGKVPSIDFSFIALCKDGSSIEVGAHSSLANYHGRPAIIGLMQDISAKKRAEEEIRRYIQQLRTAFMSTVEVATTISELRDPYTAGHERRVAQIAVAIGAELGFDDRRLEGLRVAGYLHDLGKITIPAEILSKPGKLSAIEYNLIQGHAQASYDVLKNVDFPWPVAQIALQHHERIDGSGYPQGLKGEAILLEARIMAVADVVEAMSSHRPYRPGLGIDKALAEIERGRGSAYEPQIADACLRLFREKGYSVPA